MQAPVQRAFPLDLFHKVYRQILLPDPPLRLVATPRARVYIEAIRSAGQKVTTCGVGIDVELRPAQRRGEGANGALETFHGSDEQLACVDALPKELKVRLSEFQVSLVGAPRWHNGKGNPTLAREEGQLDVAVRLGIFHQGAQLVPLERMRRPIGLHKAVVAQQELNRIPHHRDHGDGSTSAFVHQGLPPFKIRLIGEHLQVGAVRADA
mmetsp:Transcript_20649/g.57605  ORF Transcript_20649/g.57605 Transcript_20649/m.57605 type:complete len:209 (-) Transcript_20649:397-1023(-)